MYQGKSVLKVYHESQVILVKLPLILYWRMRQNRGPFLHVNHNRQKHWRVVQCGTSWFQNSWCVHQDRGHNGWASAGCSAFLSFISSVGMGGLHPTWEIGFRIRHCVWRSWCLFWDPQASFALQTWSPFGRTQWDCCWLLGARRLGAHGLKKRGILRPQERHQHGEQTKNLYWRTGRALVFGDIRLWIWAFSEGISNVC